MPKIYEYFGLVIRFFSNEHEPIHVHAFYLECQTKIELFIENGIIIKIAYTKVAGFDYIPTEKMKDLESLIEIHKYDIIQLWIKYFVLKEKVVCTKITSRLK